MEAAFVKIAHNILRFSPRHMQKVTNLQFARLAHHQNVDSNIGAVSTNDNVDIARVKNDAMEIEPSQPEADVKRSEVAPPSGGYEYFKTVVKLQTTSPTVPFKQTAHLLNGETAQTPSIESRSETNKSQPLTTASLLDIAHPNTIKEKPEGTLTAIVRDDRMLQNVKTEKDLVHLVKKRLRMQRVKTNIPETAYNLSAYVQESETLQKMIAAGVDLSKVELDPDAAEYLLKVDWETGIQPYIDLLCQIGVTNDEFGKTIASFPSLFQEDIDNLKVRLNYLESKKFSEAAIARIVTKCPRILGYTTKELDAKLGFLQKEFQLLGDELRTVVTRNPKVTIFHNTFIHVNRLALKDLMSFSNDQIKKMVMATPKLILSGRKGVQERFEYLHNEMNISHEAITWWPQILRTRVFIIRQRHLFLSQLGDAQYDPSKENYVSLKALATGRDTEFCERVAKVPLAQFKDFLKTL